MYKLFAAFRFQVHWWFSRSKFPMRHFRSSSLISKWQHTSVLVPRWVSLPVSIHWNRTNAECHVSLTPLHFGHFASNWRCGPCRWKNIQSPSLSNYPTNPRQNVIFSNSLEIAARFEKRFNFIYTIRNNIWSGDSSLSAFSRSGEGPKGSSESILMHVSKTIICSNE